MQAKRKPKRRTQNTYDLQAAEAIADNKVAVKLVRTDQAAERGQLLYITGFGGAIVNLYAVPAFRVLRGPGKNRLFNAVKAVIAGKTKRTCRRGVIAESH